MKLGIEGAMNCFGEIWVYISLFACLYHSCFMVGMYVLLTEKRTWNCVYQLKPTPRFSAYMKGQRRMLDMSAQAYPTPC